MRLLIAIVITLGINAHAVNIQTDDIRELMDAKSKSLLLEIENNKTLYENDTEKLKQLVEKEIESYFFFNYMSRFVAGKYWRKMNKQQQRRYQALFKELLIGAYASAIINFRYQDIVLGNAKPGRKKNRFNLTMYAKHAGNRIRLDYEIAKTKKGPKIINVKIEGVSLLINYRKSFTQILSTENPEALIEFIQQAIEKRRQKK